MDVRVTDFVDRPAALMAEYHDKWRMAAGSGTDGGLTKGEATVPKSSRPDAAALKMQFSGVGERWSHVVCTRAGVQQCRHSQNKHQSH
jgi:hypothetical protein